MATFERDCENPMISKMSCHIMPCHIFTAYANWCKHKKHIYLNNELSLLDIINLIDINGLEIPVKHLIRFAKREPSEVLCIFLEFQHSTCTGRNCPREDSHVDWLTFANDHECSSLLLLSLFLSNSGQYRFAEQILRSTIMDESKYRSIGNLDIYSIKNRTGYSWLLSKSAVKQIQEYRSIFNVNDIKVSTEMFIRYLLCVCQKNLEDHESLKIEFERMKEIPQHMREKFDHLLLLQAAKIIDDKSFASEISKAFILSTVKRIETLISTTEDKKDESIRCFEQLLELASNADVRFLTGNIELTKAHCKDVQKYAKDIIYKLAEMMTCPQMPKLDKEFADYCRSDMAFTWSPLVHVPFSLNMQREALFRHKLDRNMTMFMAHSSMKEIIFRLMNQLFSYTDCDLHQRSKISDWINKFFDFDQNFLEKAKSLKCDEDILIAGNDEFRNFIRRFYIKKRNSELCHVIDTYIKISENDMSTDDSLIPNTSWITNQCRQGLSMSHENYQKAI